MKTQEVKKNQNSLLGDLINQCLKMFFKILQWPFQMQDETTCQNVLMDDEHNVYIIVHHKNAGFTFKITP